MRAIIQFIKPLSMGDTVRQIGFHFNPGDIVSCDLKYEGVHAEQCSVPCADLLIPGGISLSNVPNSCFRILPEF